MSSDSATLRKPSGSWGWLVIGVALLLFANGRWILPSATWLAPIGWLVFLERSRTWRALATAFVLFVLVQFVVWRGIIPAPGALYYGIAGIYAAVYFLPFALHRSLAGKLAGFKATLVFPVAWVGLEFVFHSWITPYGSWFSIAYTQTDFSSLMQLAAIAGTAGISFLMTWFAAVVAWSLGPERSTAQRRHAAMTFGIVLCLVLVFGQLRLSGPGPGGQWVRVAGILPSPELMAELQTAFAPVRGGEPFTDSLAETVSASAKRLNDDLIDRTIREGRAGARLVAWSETAGRVLRSDEEALLERARRVAATEAIDLILAYGVWHPDRQPPFENKVVAVSAAGVVAWDYRKANPVVGGESTFIAPGDGVVRRLETPYGVVGAVICHDLDFAPLLRQAHRKRIGLVVGPAADWPAITALHANMATLRAIESGFSLFRPTSDGRSIATDTRGRTLAAVDYADDAVIAQVPARSVRTPYGTIGDLFAWLCLITLFVLVGLGVLGRKA